MADAWSALERVRSRAPLVHNITNYVAMDVTANALLALGASPAMVHAPEEVEEFVALADALVVNVGTLSRDWVAAMRRAAERATALGKPWVLDPVGAGATAYRTGVARELARLGPTVVRGNASEILALAGAAGAVSTRGVDSVHGSDEALDAARELAASLGATVAVTGAVDRVTDGTRLLRVENGHPMMAKVTALGCTATAVAAAFVAADAGGDAPLATAHALATLGLCGEIAAREAAGPGSLRWRLLDALHSLDREAMAGARVREEAPS